MQVTLSEEMIKMVCEVSEIATYELQAKLQTYKDSLPMVRPLTDPQEQAIKEKIEQIEAQIDKAIGVNGVFTEFLDEAWLKNRK